MRRAAVGAVEAGPACRGSPAPRRAPPTAPEAARAPARAAVGQLHPSRAAGRELPRGDRLVRTEQAEHRRAQAAGGPRRRVAGQRPRQTAAAAPQHRLGGLPPQRDDAREVRVGFGVEDGQPWRQRRVGTPQCAPASPARPRAATRSPLIGAQPSACRAGQLAPAAGDRAPGRERPARRRHASSRPAGSTRRLRPARCRATGCPASCRRCRLRAAPAPAPPRRRPLRRPCSPASRCRAPRLAAAHPRSAPPQKTGTGPARPTNSAAVSKAPVRSSAIRRRVGILATAPRLRGRNVLAEAVAERSHLLVPPFIRGAVPGAAS